ncbi:MAG: hypothetical protein K2G09_03280 [Paramuribaculum sp.]|nr:hypothetical protein [Paramuribaculum sp.]
MIKKITLGISVAIAALSISSCSKTQSSLHDRIARALSENKPELAAELCNTLYSDLQNCSVETLGDLTMSYYTLSVINSSRSNEIETYDAMEHMVSCYESAMKKNPTAAKALWLRIADESLNHGQSLDIPLIADSFRAQLNLRTLLGEDITD